LIGRTGFVYISYSVPYLLAIPILVLRVGFRDSTNKKKH
jgi:hypothetical protein